MSGQHVFLSSWNVVNLYIDPDSAFKFDQLASVVAFLCPRIHACLHPRSMNVSWHVSGIFPLAPRIGEYFPEKDVTSK